MTRREFSHELRRTVGSNHRWHMSLLLLPLFLLLLLFVAAARPAAVSFNSATSDTRAERKRPDIHGQNVAPKNAKRRAVPSAQTRNKTRCRKLAASISLPISRQRPLESLHIRTCRPLRTGSPVIINDDRRIMIDDDRRGETIFSWNRGGTRLSCWRVLLLVEGFPRVAVSRRKPVAILPPPVAYRSMLSSPHARLSQPRHVSPARESARRSRPSTDRAQRLIERADRPFDKKCPT